MNVFSKSNRKETIMGNDTDTTPEILEAAQEPDEPGRDLTAQATLFETVDQAEEFIDKEPYKHDFFSKENLLIHLNLMKFNPYLEWYNTLLLYHYQDFSNTSYVAKTLDLWLNEIHDENLEKAIHKTEINLLFPTLIQEDEQPDQFEWQLIPFYLITTVEAGAAEEMYLPIHAMTDIFDFERYQMILKLGWQNNFIQNYIKQFRFIQFEDEMTKEFYANALLFIFQDELHCPERVELMDTTEFFNPVAVYRRLHRLVANLPQAYLLFLQNLKTTYKSLENKNMKRTPEFKGYSDVLAMKNGVRK